jgi:hypothetical protein
VLLEGSGLGVGFRFGFGGRAAAAAAVVAAVVGVGGWVAVVVLVLVVVREVVLGVVVEMEAAVAAVLEGGGEWCWAVAEVDTDTETEEEATEGALAGLKVFVFGFGLGLEEPESRDEKRLAGLEAPLVCELPINVGDDAVAVVLVTDGAEGCPRLMEAGVSRIGAAADGIVMVFVCFSSFLGGVSLINSIGNVHKRASALNYAFIERVVSVSQHEELNVGETG